MGYKRYVQNKVKKAGRKTAFKLKKKHDVDMSGKTTILVPHPDIPKTFIEVIVDE